MALVRFQVPESADRVRLFTETLLDKMGISFQKVLTHKEGNTLHLTIEGIVETGFVIGKNGQMLETIQYLLNRVFESDRQISRIYIDADGYRERRESQFLNQYIPMFKKLKSSGEALTLEPMRAGERRIIHRYVERDKALRTLTIGEGENKRIVVFSSKLSEKEVLQQKGQGERVQRNATRPKPKTAAPAKTPEKTDKKPAKAFHKSHYRKPYTPRKDNRTKHPEGD